MIADRGPRTADHGAKTRFLYIYSQKNKKK